MTILTPEDYGAVGSGADDDQPALMAMMAAGRHEAASGRSVTFALGRRHYGLARPFELYPSTHFNFRMEGAGNSAGGTRFVALHGFSGSAVSGANAIALPGELADSDSWASYQIRGFGIENRAGPACQEGFRFGVEGRKLQGLCQNPVEDISVSGFTYDFVVRATRLVEFNRCSAWSSGIQASGGNGAFGWFFSATPSCDTGEITLNGCTADVDRTQFGTALGIFNWTGGGMNNIQVNKFVGYHAHKYVWVRVWDSGTARDVVMDGMTMDGVGDDGLYAEAYGKDAAIQSLKLLGGQIRGNRNAVIAIARDGAHFIAPQVKNVSMTNNSGAVFFGESVSGAQISDNNIFGPNHPGNALIRLKASREFSVNDNLMSQDPRPGGSGSSATNMVWVEGNCSAFAVHDNKRGNVNITGQVVRDDTPSSTRKYIAGNI